jgi:hypothetical protein
VSDAEGLAFSLVGPQRRTVFLNRFGGTYRRGANNSSAGTSSIVSRTTTIDAYGGSDSDWAGLVDCIEDQFAGYDLDIVTEDPGDAVHIETVLGDTGAAVGYGSNIWGVAPRYWDCSTAERAVAFVFTDSIYYLRDQCETASHEIGHALGLEHEYLCQDPMTYLSGCGAKAFQDVAASCGEYSRRSCTCGQTQNTHDFLLARLGPRPQEPAAPEEPEQPEEPVEPEPSDEVAPVVELVSPTDGENLEGDGFVEVVASASDDEALDRVVLKWHFNGIIEMDCDAPPAVATCSHDGETFTWRIRVGTGPRAFSAVAFDAAGNTSETQTRSITLNSDVEAPPPVTPQVTVLSPAASQQVSPGERVEVRVAASDDTGIAEVDLWWVYPSGTYYHYDLRAEPSGEWALGLRLPPSAASGERRLRVAATDTEGNRTVHPDVVIQVVR